MITTKKIWITFLLVIALIAGNVLYWVTSDIQQKCYLKIKQGNELNFYEKSSIYSINLCMCAFGWVVSPEATRQQIWCTIPTKGTIIRKNRYFARHEKVRELMAKYPNATEKNPAYLAWKPQNNEFGQYTAYNLKNMRIAVACNGIYLYKENSDWVISYIKEYAFPKLSKPTIIGPFKFHEGLIRHLQDIGWLYKPKFKWILKS